MTTTKLMQLIDTTIALDRELREKGETLKSHKKLIASEAATRADEHAATDGGGWSWTLSGSDGALCRVTMPAPSLKSDIDGEGKTIEKVREVAGAHFARLFMQAPKYKLVSGFRDSAAMLLGKSAAKLIKLCTTMSSPKVSFETKAEET
jgi:hypothetical protein